MTLSRPPLAADRASRPRLPLGSAGDLAAAQAVARALLRPGGDAAAPGERALRTLILTAACLHVAQIARDDVDLSDVIFGLRDLLADNPVAAGLRGSPLPFVRYVGVELSALTPEDARGVIDRILVAVDAAAAIRPLVE